MWKRLAVVATLAVTVAVTVGCRKKETREAFFQSMPTTLCECAVSTLSWSTPTDGTEIEFTAVPAGAVEIPPGPYDPEGSMQIEVCEDASISMTMSAGGSSVTRRLEFDVVAVEPLSMLMSFEPVCTAGVFDNAWTYHEVSRDEVSPEIVATTVINRNDRDIWVFSDDLAETLVSTTLPAELLPRPTLEGSWSARTIVLSNERCPVEGTTAPPTGFNVIPTLSVEVLAVCE